MSFNVGDIVRVTNASGHPNLLGIDLEVVTVSDVWGWVDCRHPTRGTAYRLYPQDLVGVQAAVVVTSTPGQRPQKSLGEVYWDAICAATPACAPTPWSSIGSNHSIIEAGVKAVEAEVIRRLGINVSPKVTPEEYKKTLDVYIATAKEKGLIVGYPAVMSVTTISKPEPAHIACAFCGKDSTYAKQDTRQRCYDCYEADK